MAKGKPKKRNRKRRISREAAAERRLKQRHQAVNPGSVVVTGAGSDAVKMSEVLGEFAEPYVQDIEDLEEYRDMVTVAIVGWNMALLPAEKRSAAIKDTLATLPVFSRRMVRGLVEEMVQRKLRYFPQYRRAILDYDVADTGDGWYLSVISSLDSVEEQGPDGP